MLQYQDLHIIPTFHCIGPLADQDLSVVFSAPVRLSQMDARKRYDPISATFLQVAIEIHRRDVQDHPSEEAVAIEQRLAPWRPCEGHPVIHVSSWNSDTRS